MLTFIIDFILKSAIVILALILVCLRKLKEFIKDVDKSCVKPQPTINVNNLIIENRLKYYRTMWHKMATT